MNVFGGNPFAGGVPPQYPVSFPQQGFGQLGGGAPGFYGGGAPFQGGNVFPGGYPFPPTSGFPQSTVGGQFGQGYNYPPVSGPFGSQPTPYGFPYAPGQQAPYGSTQQTPYGSALQPPYGSSYPLGQQPAYGSAQQPPYTPSYPPGQQPSNANPNYFGGGAYGQPRSRRSSHRQSRAQRYRSSTSSSSSSSDEAPNRGSPFQKRDNPYNNGQPLANAQPIQPGGGVPVIPSQPLAW